MKNTKVKKKHHFFKRLFIFLFILLLIAIAGSIAVIAYFYPKVPPLNTALFDYSQNAVIYDRNDQPYQNLQGEENRQTLMSEQIPENVKNAFIAIEDKRFYDHPGVDIFGVLRAVREVISNQNLNGSGGSTITQQLIKLTHLTSEKTIQRKFDEWVLALQLEQVYSKDQILTSYLNKVNFHGSEGIQAASRQYFGKNIEELNLGQIAILAAVPNSPSYFDPYTYDETNEIRRNENGQIILNPNNQTRALNVINEMQDQGYIIQDEAEAARQIIKTNPGLVVNNPNKTYSYFTDAVYYSLVNDIQEALNMSEDEAVKYINTTGLKIYSTVDPTVQTALEQASLNDNLFPGQSENAVIVSEATGETYLPEVGATIINNEDGGVVGIVGGRNEKTSLSLNRATSQFQVGSSTKPLTTYGPALEEKIITLASIFNDEPININGWQPQNSELTFIGPTTVRNALKESINTIAVQVNQKLGIPKSMEYAQKLGLTISEGDNNSAALALGGYVEGQSTEQMASAYSTFARNGDYIAPYLYYEVQDNNGAIIVSHNPTKEKVFSPETSFLITDVLKQASNGGTTTINVNGTEIAGKTGTIDNQLNAWYCGYSPTYSMAVWYGYDTGSVNVNGTEYPLNIGIFGGDKPGPAALFENVFNTIEVNTKTKTFTKPSTIVQYPEGPTLIPDGSSSEYYIKGTEPNNQKSTSSSNTNNSSSSGTNISNGFKNSSGNNSSLESNNSSN